jgi:hypothetical protein
LKNLISRFRAELLDADIDLRTCDAALKGPGAFLVASRVTGSRMAVAVVFGIPALYLAFRGLGSEGTLIGLLAIVFCPILAGIAILFGFVIAEKSFDRPNDRATKSIRLFSLRSVEARALPPNGTITISSRWNTSGDDMQIEYLTSVEGLNGFAFTTTEYQSALEFASKLANVLNYRIGNNVEPEYQK